MMTGSWKNFEELEEQLTLKELNKIVEAMREQEERYIRSIAIIMGAEIDDKEQEEESQQTARDRIKENIRKKRGESDADAPIKNADRELGRFGARTGLGYEEVRDNSQNGGQ